MRILVLHKGFPGQFKHLIPQLKSRGDEIWTISTSRPNTQISSNIQYISYVPKQVNGSDTFPLASELETKIIRGEAVASIANKLSKRGFQPDLIVGHPGWGEMLFLGDIWPNIPQLHYIEFFHGVPGTDNDISDIYAKPQDWAQKARARIKNAHLLSSLEQMSAGVSPTNFQQNLLPNWAKQKTSVIHDGINTEWLSPNQKTILIMPNGHILKYGNPIITFVNRTFEPYRGIHIFLEALAKLQSINPKVHTILVGEDTPTVSYGANREDGRGWLTSLKKELGDKLDWERIHPLGRIKHSTLRDVYRISAAHVYLSYPFVLSWSLLEAMSCGAIVVGSKTAPVEEIIQHKVNGLLVPFQDSDALTITLLDILNRPEKYIELRKKARNLIQKKYDLKSCLGMQLKLIDKLAKK